MPEGPEGDGQQLSRASVAVHPLIDRAGAYAWRLIAIAVAVVGALWLMGQLKVVVLPILIAILASRGLVPLSDRLRSWRFPPAIASLTVVLGLFAVLGGLVAVMAPSVATEFRALGPTITDGLEEIEAWLVNDGPVDVTQDDLDRYSAQAFERLGEWVTASDGQVAGAASLLIEIPTGFVLTVILTFFFVKDGRLFLGWARDRIPAAGRPAAARMADSAWSTLGGYLRGVTMLGTFEALVIGGVLFLVGGELVLPVMVLTFLAAFLPIVGAIVAGIVAVLVALVTVGPTAAIIVGVAAIVVQQLDGDLLAPVVYGQALQLHPVVILVAIVGGAALFGFVGAVLAVPVAAVAINAIVAAREPDPVPSTAADP